jgi:uncharacterized protein
MRRDYTARDRRVFVDTSGFYALLDASDTHHSDAVHIIRDLAATRSKHYTTNVVVIECHALVLSHLGHTAATTFLHEVLGGPTTVVRARAAGDERARAIIFQYDDKDFSYTDAISFAVMERLGIARAFSFDRHFSQYGFMVVQPGAV